MLPESGGTDQAITAVFDAARRRALMRHSLQGVAVALLALAALGLVIPPSRHVLVIFAAGAGAAIIAFLRIRRSDRTPRALAASLESRHPELQNLAITAEELLRHPDRAPAWIRERVFADAAAALQHVHVSALWPVGRLAGQALPRPQPWRRRHSHWLRAPAPGPAFERWCQQGRMRTS